MSPRKVVVVACVYVHPSALRVCAQWSFVGPLKCV
jgi:hypothetical protein